MFPLQRYFSIASFVALALVTVLLFYVNRTIALGQVMEMGEKGNVALAQLFANSLWPRFSSYVKSVSGESGDALRWRPETSQIHDESSKLARDLPVLKLKIYDLHGLTVFSSEPIQIGEDKSKNPGYASVASGGKPVSKLSHRGTFSAFSGAVSNVALVETYVPVRNEQGRLEGVFELYSNVTPVVQRIEREQFRLSLAFISLFLVLYVVLFLIVRHANKILKSQYLQIEENQKVLGMKNHALEQSLKVRSKLEKELSAAKATMQNHGNVLPVVQTMCNNIATVFVKYVGSDGKQIAKEEFQEWLRSGATGPVSVPNFVRLLTSKLPDNVDQRAFEREALSFISLPITEGGSTA